MDIFNNSPLTAAIIPCKGRQLAEEYACDIIEILTRYGCKFNVPKRCSDAVTGSGVSVCDSESQAIAHSDFVISIGGDGTILRTAKEAAEFGKAVLGVNCGRVGFVAGLEPSELDKLSHLFSGEYTVDERMMLDVTVISGGNTTRRYALNDVTITNGTISRMVDLDVCLNGEFITSYRADGLILSTPTGSTAYSLSAGGPVIEPHMKCILLTPICPHSLFSRSVLFSDTSDVTITRGEESRAEPYVTFDGKESVVLEQDGTVDVSRADITAKFIRVNSKNFYRILNDKLNERMG